MTEEFRKYIWEECLDPRAFEDLCRKSGVYAIVCRMSLRWYIGSTIRSVWTRIRVHCRALEEGEHSNELLQSEYNAFGPDAFVVGLLHEWDGVDEAQLRQEEASWIARFMKRGRCYNTPEGKGWRRRKMKPRTIKAKKRGAANR